MSGTWTPGPSGPTDGNDLYEGTEGNDAGKGGSPFLDGGFGNDTLLGLGGDDGLLGGDGDDVVDGGSGNDLVFGGAGQDTVLGGEGDDYISGGLGDDLLLGGDGQDQLDGSSGDDTIDSGAGHDLIEGGAGNDSLVGGDGYDYAHYYGAPSEYRWTDLGDGRWQIQDTVPDRDGTDTLEGIEGIVWNTGGPDESYGTPPCYLKGTLIATPRGDVPVETLRVGDLVLAVSGGFERARPVRWIGRRRADAVSHPRPASVFPIRIRAGALREGVPQRDLLVSPDHSVLVEGVLVPAGRLVNGRSILQDRSIPRPRYFHVELDTHDLVLAEGAPAETYLEDGNRHIFENAGPVISLHPDFAVGPATAWQDGRACAPQVLEGPRLYAIRARLEARAMALPPPTRDWCPAAQPGSRRLQLAAGVAALR